MKLWYLEEVLVRKKLFVCQEMKCHQKKLTKTQKINLTGSVYAHAHTFNAKSRKYFNRTFLSSGSLGFWHTPYHEQEIWDCLEIDGLTNVELVEYLKTANISTLTKCNGTDWLLNYESPNAIRPFLTKRANEIYTSDEPPVLDVLFVVASQVNKINEWLK